MSAAQLDLYNREFNQTLKEMEIRERDIGRILDDNRNMIKSMNKKFDPQTYEVIESNIVRLERLQELKDTLSVSITI